MLNRVTLQGNIGKDAEVQRLQNGTPVAKFSVATSERYKDAATNEWKDGETQWHDVVAWRTLAEQAEKTFKKGKAVHVEGKLTHRKYTDKNGVERYTTEVVASSMHVVERAEKRETNFPSEPPPQYTPNQPPPTFVPVSDAGIAPSEASFPTSEPVGEDGLPF